MKKIEVAQTVRARVGDELPEDLANPAPEMSRASFWANVIVAGALALLATALLGYAALGVQW